jgi:hypothetical protein
MAGPTSLYGAHESNLMFILRASSVNGGFDITIRMKLWHSAAFGCPSAASGNPLARASPQSCSVTLSFTGQTYIQDHVESAIQISLVWAKSTNMASRVLCASV